MGMIAEHLVIEVSDAAVQQDDDAAARMTALQEIDARVVRYTTMITAFRDPEGAHTRLRSGSLTQAELATLGDEGLARECAAAFRNFAGGTPPTRRRPRSRTILRRAPRYLR